MDKILAQFWAICILKAGPQDLPASRFLAVASSVLYVLLGLVYYLDRLAVPSAFGAAMVDYALLAGLSYLLLWVRLYSNRWLQTITALAGSGIILTAAALIADYGMRPFLPEVADPGAPMTSVAFVYWLLSTAQVIWSVVIMTHILRHALAAQVLLAAAFTAVYVYVAYNVLSTLFFAVHE